MSTPPVEDEEGSAEGCMVWSLGISRAMRVRMALQSLPALLGSLVQGLRDGTLHGTRRRCSLASGLPAVR